MKFLGLVAYWKCWQRRWENWRKKTIAIRKSPYRGSWVINTLHNKSRPRMLWILSLMKSVLRASDWWLTRNCIVSSLISSTPQCEWCCSGLEITLFFYKDKKSMKMQSDIYFNCIFVLYLRHMQLVLLLSLLREIALRNSWSVSTILQIAFWPFPVLCLSINSLFFSFPTAVLST